MSMGSFCGFCGRFSPGRWPLSHSHLFSAHFHTENRDRMRSRFSVCSYALCSSWARDMTDTSKAVRVSVRSPMFLVYTRL